MRDHWEMANFSHFLFEGGRVPHSAALWVLAGMACLTAEKTTNRVFIG